MANASLESLNQEIIQCKKCPRLIEYCQKVAQTRRRAYLDQEYWGKPVPGWGDPDAALLIVGLAPGAHGANRTGRMFTGDGSGNFLYAALHRAGLCNQAASVTRQDGLRLTNTYITAVGRCAPPENKPSPGELLNCRPFLIEELETLKTMKVVLALGRIAFDGFLGAYSTSHSLPRPWPSFGHGACYNLDGLALVASYHVSRQNTQTGRLTTLMFDRILEQCKVYLP